MFTLLIGGVVVTWLVTGASGYLGSSVINALQIEGKEVIGLDRVLTNQSNSAQIFKYDLNNDVVPFFTKYNFEGVVHLAALKDLRASVLEPAEYWNNNFVSTKNLLDSLIKTGVSKIIFASTAAIYGTNVSRSTDEGTAPSLKNPYSASKYASELMIEQYAARHGLEAISLRLFNVSGPALNRNETSDGGVISKIVKSNLEKSVFQLNGNDFATPDGTAIRDYISVRDVANIICKFTSLPMSSAKNEIINLGTGKGTSLKEILDTVENITHSPNRVKVNTRNLQDADEAVSNGNKLSTLLRDYSFESIEKIVENTVANMQKQ